MSQKQKGWKDKILDKAATKLRKLEKKYIDKIPEDEKEYSNDLFKQNNNKEDNNDLFKNASGGRIVSSFYKGGKI